VKKCSPAKQTEIPSTGEGPAVAVVVNQKPGDPGGWIVEVYADVDQADAGTVYVGKVQLSAAGTHPSNTRVAATMTLPLARGWRGIVRSPSPAPSDPISVALIAGPATSTGFVNVAP
jgi:hypothetical protein